MPLKTFFFAAFGLLFVSGLFAQQKRPENYAQLFSDDFQKAIRFLKDEKWMEDFIRKHQLDPKEVIAIAFPELIRYNAIQDKIETFALESLYVQYGKDYANFSVSEFQIKPSFAEDIEIDFLDLYGEEKMDRDFHLQVNEIAQSQENRSKRLNRIKDKRGMVNYLCLFFKVMEAKYPQWNSEEEKLKFYATAYNCGYQKPKKEVNSFLARRFFHTGLSSMSTKYCYAEISWYYYQQP